jgi:hypothetical protein
MSTSPRFGSTAATPQMATMASLAERRLTEYLSQAANGPKLPQEINFRLQCGRGGRQRQEGVETGSRVSSDGNAASSWTYR